MGFLQVLIAVYSKRREDRETERDRQNESGRWVVGSIDGCMEGVRTEVRKEGRAVGRWAGRQDYLGKQRNSDSKFPRIQIRRQLIEVYLGLPQILNTNFKTVLHINPRPLVISKEYFTNCHNISLYTDRATASIVE